MSFIYIDMYIYIYIYLDMLSISMYYVIVSLSNLSIFCQMDSNCIYTPLNHHTPVILPKKVRLDPSGLSILMYYATVIL